MKRPCIDAYYYLIDAAGQTKDGILSGSIHQHFGRTNYLFADGHAKALKAMQTLSPHPLWGPAHLQAQRLVNSPRWTLPIKPIDPKFIQRMMPEYR